VAQATCPVHALEQWLHVAKIDFGPVFVRTSRDGKRALETRLSSKHVARLIKATVLKSGVRYDLPEAKRLALFSGHSLRARLASSAEIDERYVQKQLGHASAEMTKNAATSPFQPAGLVGEVHAAIPAQARQVPGESDEGSRVVSPCLAAGACLGVITVAALRSTS
jgi:site-specific recombinase XerC